MPKSVEAEKRSKTHELITFRAPFDRCDVQDNIELRALSGFCVIGPEGSGALRRCVRCEWRSASDE